MVKFNKKSFSISAFWVSTNDRLSDFNTSSWQPGESLLPMIIVRLLLTVASLAILTWSVVENANPYWMIYLTHWGILIVAATMLSGLVVSFICLFKRPVETTSLPWYVSLYWVLFNVSVPISIMITALYWILLYDPAVHEKFSPRALWLDISTHGLTSCIILAELLISRTPIRLAHIYQPLVLGLWYVVFSGVYYAAGGTDSKGNVYIYAVLNWQEPQSTGIVTAGSVVALIMLYLILWGIAFIRDKLSVIFVRTKGHDLPFTPPVATTDKQIV